MQRCYPVGVLHVDVRTGFNQSLYLADIISAIPAGYRSGNKRVRYDTEGGRETGRTYTTPSSFSTESAFGNGCCHSHASRSRKPVITSQG